VDERLFGGRVIGMPVLLLDDRPPLAAAAHDANSTYLGAFVVSHRARANRTIRRGG
jgi:hypothetical protein